MSSRWLERQRRLEAEEARLSAKAVLAEIVSEPVLQPTGPPKPRPAYRWVKGDDIWVVATRFGCTPLELSEHNDIDNPKDIQPGTVLLIPVAYKPDNRSPSIEVLPQFRPMRVSRSNGVRKFSFGLARTREDIRETGPLVSYKTKVAVTAIAHVPLHGQTIDFYMDAIALGDYVVTGRVRYTIGFKPDDLADGYVSNHIARAVLTWGL